MDLNVIELPRIGELMLTQMANDWVDNLIFSDKHIKPHEESLILAVFPALAHQMNAVIKRDCGLVFEFYDQRCKDKTVRVNGHNPRRHWHLPVFETCKLLHRDQVISLQQAIDAIKLTRGRKLVLAN